jgi:pimeloyl-ACP methyl ester carboxylesterase
MPTLTVRDGAEIYYKDWGAGPVVFFSHGWPLSADMWDYQMMFLASKGFRVIAHDRRGFGRSSQPWDGYDYDTFADDIAAVLDHLDVKDVTMVGFSMGGGDVARYVTRSGGARVGKVVLTSAVTPIFGKSDDYPEGVDISVFDWIRSGLLEDRADFLDKFNPTYYGTNREGRSVSLGAQAQTLQIALASSIKAAYDCVGAFSQTDFRPDMKALTMPTLVVHGGDDQVVPLSTGQLAHAMVPGSILKVYPGAPHALVFTHKDQFNQDLLDFLQA